MNSSPRYGDIEFGGPATYRIIVQGTLTEDWSERLAGMAISIASGESGKTRTELVGPIRDQAELSGVLDTLYGLHMSIVRVEQVEDDTTGQPE